MSPHSVCIPPELELDAAAAVAAASSAAEAAAAAAVLLPPQPPLAAELPAAEEPSPLVMAPVEAACSSCLWWLKSVSDFPIHMKSNHQVLRDA